MRRFAVELSRPGWAILIAVSVLVAIGVASIYVTDTHYVSGHDGPANALKQAIRAVIGLLVGFGILRLGYNRIARYSYFLFVLVVILLLPLFAAKALHASFGGLTAPRNGAYRWIHLPGFPLQPSELMKVAFVLALAWYLRYRNNYRRFAGLLLPMVVAAVPLGLILFEPDLGTVVLLAIVMFVMLFAAGAKASHIVALLLIGAALAPLAWGQIKGYQRLRVTAVLLQSDALRQAIARHPEKYRMLATKRQAVEWAAGSGYQLVHSKNAIGSGGLAGQGWGEGTYVTSSLLPDRHNDFIFAVIAHQWGLLGCLVVLACFVVIAICGVMIATETAEPFARLLAVGVTAMIVTQVLVNVGMSVGLMPITGMTLPFVSYGGSSLLTSFIAAALLISVSQRRPYLLALRPFEFGVRRKKALYLAEPGEGMPEGAGASPADRPSRAASA